MKTKMKKSLMLYVLVGVMLTCTPAVQAVEDIFSVNFYAYGKGGAEYWDQTSWRETVTMESGQSAGVGTWHTTGWENYLIPWGLSSPANPVTITSTLGSTATFTLNDCRNGGPYWWSQTRTTLLGDGDGDMMDGHANGTEDPYDGTLIFDMTVSNITFDLYDVIIYIGGNQGQWGDGKGKIVFNGGPEQEFYLGPNAEFSSYAEIVDNVTPGNYKIFHGLTASTFTAQVWGNGSNHLSPTGFQIMEVEPSPPGQAVNPNPADGATNVWSGTDLSWIAGYDSESSDVYFGTNPTPGAGEFQGNQTGTTFNPGVLAANTTYFWRIDQVNTIGTTTGQVWSFTTNAEAPSPGRNTFLVPMTYTGAGWEEFAFLAAVPASAAINDAKPSVIALDETETIPGKVYEYITLYNPYEAYTIDTTGSLDDVACYLAQTFWTTTTRVVLCDDSDYAGALAASALAGRLEVPLMFFDSATGLSAAALNVIDNDLQCTAALTVNGNSTVTSQLSGIGVSQTSLADDKAIITWMQNNGYPVDYLAVCNSNDRTMSDYAPKGSLAAALLAAGRNGAVAALNYVTEWNTPFLRSSTTTIKPAGLPANTEPPRLYFDPNDLDYDIGSCTVNGQTYNWVVVRMTDGDRFDAAFIDFNRDGDYGDAGEYCPRTCELTINGKRYTFGVNSTQPNPYAWGELRFTYPSDDKLKEDLQSYHDQIGHYPKYMAIVGVLQVLPAAHALSYDLGWCDYVMNDNYYADVDDDPLYDIATGRIVGENVTYVTLNASRALTYDDLQYPPASDHVFHQCTEEFETELYSNTRQLENCGFTIDEWLYLPANEYKTYGVFIQDEHGWPFGIARDEFLQNSSWTVSLIEGGGCNMASLDMYYDAAHHWYQTNAVVLAREGAVCFNAWVRGTGSGKTISRDAFYKAISEGASMGEAHQYALNIMTAKNENAIKSYDLNANIMYGDPAVTLYRPTAQTYAPANVTANGNTLTVNAPGTYWVDYINSTGKYVYSAPGLAGFISEAVDGTFFATYTTGLQISDMTQEGGVPSPLGWMTMRDGQDYVIDEHWDNTRTIYWRVRLEEFNDSTGSFTQTISDIDYTITTYDTLPPIPNPATFASAPVVISATEITMTATTGSDPSGPVEYYFDETSGNPGGTDSGWQTSPSYTDTGLNPGTQYTYTVRMRDALSNTGGVSAPASTTTPLAGSIPVAVPNGGFETIYKPGSTTITATITGWTQGVGPLCPIDSGVYTFSDQTTGTEADIPGWIGYDRDGWIAWGGTYGRDQATGNLQGSVSTGNNHTPGGAYCYLVNGAAWGNPAGGLIVSDASLGNIQSDATYMLSMYANGSATPIVLKLLADGIEVTPTFSVDPILDGTHQEFLRIYDVGDLTSYVGRAITIVCGIGRDAAGNQAHMDDVSLEYYTYVPVDADPPTPNPATFASAPSAVSSSQITMTATTGSDATGPVEYYFDETSGNPGGTDSGWVTNPVYNDTGLTASTQYTYTVKMRDSVTPTPNVGTASSPANATTPALPAPTFVAAGAVNSGTGTISPALPSGIAVNDILLLFVETANQAVSISNQNGGTWAAVTNSPQGTGTAGGTTATRLTVFWSRYNGTQGAPTVSDSGNHQLARMVAVRGAVTSGNPWNVTAGGVEATSDTSVSIPGATTTVANTLVVVATAGSLPDASSTTQFSAWTNANLTSLTERTDNSVNAGNGGSLGIATGIKATAGAYGNTAATRANSAVKGMISIAIKP